MRTDIGRSRGHAARIARKTSSGIAQPVLERAAVFVGAPVAERRDEAREQIAVRAVQLEHVEARRRSPCARRATNSSRTRSMSARVISRGTCMPSRVRDRRGGRSTAQSPSASGSSVPSHMQPRRALAARSGRAAGRSSRASSWCTKSTMRRHAATCSSLYIPVQPSVMRASGETQVISVTIRARRRRARARPDARDGSRSACRRRALYMSIGDTTTRFCERHAAQAERREHRRRRVGGFRRARPRGSRTSAPRPRDTSRSRRRRFSWLTRWLRVSRL